MVFISHILQTANKERNNALQKKGLIKAPFASLRQENMRIGFIMSREENSQIETH